MREKRTLRALGSTAFAATLFWDLYRDFERIEDFSTWSLILQFLYFQLPMKSKALAFFHPLSFCAAIAIPTMYMFTLIRNPKYEVDRIDSWEMSWNSLVCRSLLYNIAPLVFHSLDISSYQSNLIISYGSKPQKVQTLWASSGFFLFQLLHEMVYPRNFPTSMKLLSIVASGFSFFILYSLIIKHAYGQTRPKPTSFSK